MVFPVLILLLYLALTIFAGVVHARLVFQPFIKALKQVPITSSRMFFLIDIVALVFLVQVPIALVNLSDARLDDEVRIAVFVLAGAGIMMLVVWRFGVRMLNRLGVSVWYQRVVFLCFCLPVGLLGGFLPVPLVCELFLHQPDRRYNIFVAVLLLTILAIMTTIAYFITNWISVSALKKRASCYGANE